jgi:hypothetical protein
LNIALAQRQSTARVSSSSCNRFPDRFGTIRGHAHDNKVGLTLEEMADHGAPLFEIIYHQHHLIILDIGLPSLNGIEARLQDQI